MVKKTEPPKICKHLSGPGYDEYICLIRTCSLGGISPELWAHAVQQLFQYKKFSPLEKEPRKKDINLVFIEIKGNGENGSMTPNIPKNGNGHLKERKWTEVEKRKLDEFLLGWARWEVNYVEGFVRSVRCDGTTTNRGEICNACGAISCDESLKRSIRRVSCFPSSFLHLRLIVNTPESESCRSSAPSAYAAQSTDEA